MTDIEIKKVTLSDIDQLQKIGKQTFFETFSEVNSEENMTKYLDEGFSIEKLTNELSDNNSEFYFARLYDKIIGYLKLKTLDNLKQNYRTTKHLKLNGFMY